MSKSPEELEPGDVFMKKIGFDGSLVYCISNNNGTISFSKFTWTADTVWSEPLEAFENDPYYSYVGRKRSWLGRFLSLGGTLYPRYYRGEDLDGSK